MYRKIEKSRVKAGGWACIKMCEDSLLVNIWEEINERGGVVSEKLQSLKKEKS